MEPCFPKRTYDVLLDKDDNKKGNDSDNKKQKKDYMAGLNESTSIETFKNHIYFYCGVSTKTCLKLNIEPGLH